MIRKIGKDELKKKMDEDPKLQIVNVLDPQYHNLGLIKGSKKIPLSEVESRLGELDKNREVFVYCASYDCSASRNAAEKLQSLGFKVAAYEGGIREWKEAGFPTESERQAA